jgi:hypothetical protein
MRPSGFSSLSCHATVVHILVTPGSLVFFLFGGCVPVLSHVPLLFPRFFGIFSGKNMLVSTK